MRIQVYNRLFAGLLVFVCLISTGCTKSYDDWSRYNHDSYGWYQIIEADGAYENLETIKKDCAVRMDQTSMSFYDEAHDETPYFTFDVKLQGKKMDVQNGTFDSLEIEKADLTLLSPASIHISDSFWMEGTIHTSQGSVSIKGFFSKFHVVTGWQEVLSGHHGTLNHTKEELLPPGYSEYLSYTSLTLKPREFFSGLHQELAENALQCYMADVYPVEQQKTLLRLDDSEDFTQVVLVNESSEFKDFQIRRKAADGTEEVMYGEKGNVYAKGKSLVVQMHMDESTVYDISFSDYFNRCYTYVLKMRDDMIVLEREEP